MLRLNLPDQWQNSVPYSLMDKHRCRGCPAIVFHRDLRSNKPASEVDMESMMERFADIPTQQIQSNTFHLEWCLRLLDENSFSFFFFFFYQLLQSSTIAEFFLCVQQLVSNFVSVPFGVGQVAQYTKHYTCIVCQNTEIKDAEC